MPTREDVAKAKRLLTSPEELEFFFGRLTSAQWIQPLRDEGLIPDPPMPIESDDGVLFPFWPVSRYLVRVADQAPAPAADVLWAARESQNPRVWWDTVDALAKMPAEYSGRFVPLIKAWVHHPWRLGLEPSTAALTTHLIELGARDAAIDLAGDLAHIVQPEAWPDDQPWIPLDEYDFGEELPALAVELATFGPSGLAPLVEALERFLLVERGGGERAADLSYLWRPAIENHEQNWGHDREGHLLTAIRDGFEALLRKPEEDVQRVVGSLLASDSPVIRRIGLHLLVEHGNRARFLVTQVLTDRDILNDEHYRHELYRLASARFRDLSMDERGQFVGNVRSVADEASASATHRTPGVDSRVVRRAYVRRWFSAVAAHLAGDDRDEYESIVAELGDEAHPDFPSYHMTWIGSTAPLSAEQLLARDPDELIEFLRTWEEPQTFGPGDSVEGLAQQLSAAVAQEPRRFAQTASRYVALDPAYFDGLVNGLQNALEQDKTFAWEPVLVACDAALGMPDAEASGLREVTWSVARMSVARLLERGLDPRPGQIPITERDRLWGLLSRLAEDENPTPTDEARYGPPNMEPEIYSLNTVRGAAFHGVFLYLVWHHRQAGSPSAWPIADEDPEASALLDAHLDPDRDPSVAVRAAYGWWLPAIFDRDIAWVRARADAIVGRAATALERAAWESFLFRSKGTRLAHEVFADAYVAYAEWLAQLNAKPEERGRAVDPVERFIDHLLLPWLQIPDLRDRLPLRMLLDSGKPWLVAEVVEEAGRLIDRAKAEDVAPTLADSYQELWRLINELATNLRSDQMSQALSPFAWWFHSALPGDWTLPALVDLMNRGIVPNPESLVLARLPDVAAGDPEMSLRVIEHLAERGGEDYALRVHEGEIRRVLEVSIRADDAMLRPRAEAVIHRLGRLGLGGLGGLLRPKPDTRPGSR